MKTRLSFLMLGFSIPFHFFLNRLTFFILPSLLIWGGCQTSDKPKRLFPDPLPEQTSCFLLYELNEGKVIEVRNQERCQTRLTPNSTFKVPLAVMAIDQGLIKNEKTLFKWDGKPRFLESWNKDQTAKDWMVNSAVWVSQDLTKKMGMLQVEKYLKAFDYGNKDFSGSLTEAWLSSTGKDTLKISAYEQLEFMRRLFKNELPVSAKAMDLSKKLLVSEVSTLESLLSGKTGSGFMGETGRIGWYIGHIRTRRSEYLVITNFEENPASSKEFGGPVAREAAKKILFDRGLW